MNAKAEKDARRLFKQVCKRNNVTPTMAFWKSYRNDLMKNGMWVEFLRQSALFENSHEGIARANMHKSKVYLDK